jgi:two-component system sensor histidine kinase PilS (NtrC family)
VLVVDARGQVRAANPAARALLADNDACPQAPFSLGLHPGWLPLLAAVEGAYQAGAWPAAGSDITVAAGEDSPRALRVRARFTRGARLPVAGALRPGKPGGDEALAVLFVEALRDVQARQRQERLVAMGRISAGIAHEIRNPLAAISQANALLQEDVLLPEQQWLVRITADNVERLKRLVDDVMEAAPGGAGLTAPVRVDAAEQVRATCLDWARTAGLAQANPGRMELVLPLHPSWVWFDPEHLRRVLVNLLDNALRYSTATEGSICVSLVLTDDGFAHLSVGSDGEPMAPETERHLFEPFHSTRSRGTGLGLYICRELCERHGAVIDYVRQPGERHENVFLVLMRCDTSQVA